MDGVIVDTEPVHSYAYFQHFAELNIDISKDHVSLPSWEIRPETLFRNSRRCSPSRGKSRILIQRKRTLFNDAFDNKEDLYLIEGVEKLIQDLHGNGMQLILASSAAKVTIDRVFRRFDLHQYFTHIVSGEDFPIQNRTRPFLNMPRVCRWHQRELHHHRRPAPTASGQPKAADISAWATTAKIRNCRICLWRTWWSIILTS